LEQRKEHIRCEEKRKGCKVPEIKNENEEEIENEIRGTRKKSTSWKSRSEPMS
jgi:hypothetical protein